MKNSHWISVLTVSLCIGSAGLMTQNALANEPAAGESAAPLSRAEVIADLLVWRDSGMADLASGEEPAIFSPRYAECQARYQSMRSSTAFAALVQRIARERGEKLQVADAR